MEIKILGTGCPKSRKAYENAMKAIEELGVDSEVEKVEDIDNIFSFNSLFQIGTLTFNSSFSITIIS